MHGSRVWGLSSIALLGAAAIAFGVANPTSATPPDADEVVLVEPNGRWHLRVAGADDYTFWYGMEGDVPLFGDWDGDGFDSPGMYRPTTGFAYLSNVTPLDGGVGIGDPTLTYFFGNPGDQVFVGDWDRDGIDTLGISRNGKMYLANTHATAAADQEFWFGHPTDNAVGGAPIGGRDGIFLYRSTTGFLYYTDGIPVGDIAATSGDFFFGEPDDRVVIGDWDGDGGDSAGLFRPRDSTVHLRNTLETGVADVSYAWGQPTWRPAAGRPDVDRSPVRFVLTTSWGGVSGSYVASDPPGIGCANSRSAVCTASFPAGTEVTLYARTETGYVFVEWIGGGCGSSNPCTLILNADTSVFPIIGTGLPIRVNAGGPTLAPIDGGPEWESDTVESPSPYVNFTYADPDNTTAAWGITALDTSVPSSTPASVFSSERWAGNASNRMHWHFPFEYRGWVEVRLYFASGYPGASDLAERMFDVTIDDWLVLDDYDLAADVGQQVGVMKRFVVRPDEDGLDIVFSHLDPAAQNPLVNAIEIVEPERLNVVHASSDPVVGGSRLLDILAEVAAQPKGPGNQWTVKIMPGVYEPSELIVVEPYVNIEGSGKSQTIIVGQDLANRDPRAVVRVDGNAGLRHLKVEAREDEWSLEGIGILSLEGSPRIESVAVDLEGISLTGIRVEGGSPSIRDVDVTSSTTSTSSMAGIIFVDSTPTVANLDLEIWSGFTGGAVALSATDSTFDISHSSLVALNNQWGSTGLWVGGSEVRAKDVYVEATGGYHPATALGSVGSTLTLEDVTATVDVNGGPMTAAQFNDSIVTLRRFSLAATDGDPPNLMWIIGSKVTMTDVDLSSFEDTYNTGRGITLDYGRLPPELLVEGATVLAPDWIVTNNSTGTATFRNSILDGGPMLGSGPVVCENVWDEHGTFYPSSCPG